MDVLSLSLSLSFYVYSKYSHIHIVTCSSKYTMQMRKCCGYIIYYNMMCE